MNNIQQELNSAVINRVKALCNEKGWTPRRLATQSGLSSKTVHQLLLKTDTQYISLTTIKKIADAFEMDLSVFFDTSEFQYKPQD